MKPPPTLSSHRLHSLPTLLRGLTWSLPHPGKGSGLGTPLELMESSIHSVSWKKTLWDQKRLGYHEWVEFPELESERQIQIEEWKETKKLLILHT